MVVAGHGKIINKSSFSIWREIARQYQQLYLCQEGVVFPLSPTNNNLHCHPNLTTPVRHSIPTLEGKRVYQILHVLHSYIKLNVNQSLVCLSKWFRLPQTNMTAWCWTQIRRTAKTRFPSCVDREVHSSTQSKCSWWKASLLRHTQIVTYWYVLVVNTQHQIYFSYLSISIPSCF